VNLVSRGGSGNVGCINGKGQWTDRRSLYLAENLKLKLAEMSSSAEVQPPYLVQ